MHHWGILDPNVKAVQALKAMSFETIEVYSSYS